MRTIDRLHAWAIRQPGLRVLTILTRVLLALGFLPSGLVKILDQPFTGLPTSDPVGYFFAGFFSVHGFYRFVGVAQWLAAGMLLVPRTATLGAFLYLPIIANIFAITVGIGRAFAFTRVITGAMLLANIYLLFWDWDRWNGILPPASRDGRHGRVVVALGLMVAVTLGLLGVTRTHLARLRHLSYAMPLTMVLAGAALGLVMLVAAYRHATSSVDS